MSTKGFLFNSYKSLCSLCLFVGLVIQICGQLAVEFTVVEECPLHTFVGSLNGLSLTNLVDSFPVNTFQLLTPSEHFILNETSGEMFTQNRIDRETLCREVPASSSFAKFESNKPVHSYGEHPNQITSSDYITEFTPLCHVQLQALQFTQRNPSESDVQSHRVIIIKVTVIDINDNPPIWQEPVIHLSIPEHSPVGTRLPLPAAFDPDCGPANTTVSYSLLDISASSRVLQRSSVAQYDQDAFQLDTEIVRNPSGRDFNQMRISGLWHGQQSLCSRQPFRLWLRITRDLDYDEPMTPDVHTRTDDQFQSGSLHLKQARLQLSASDGGQPVGLTGTVLVNITVTDINDHPPVFNVHKRNQLGNRNSGVSDSRDSSPNEVVIEVEENTPVARSIYLAEASDRDETDKNRLKYSLGTSASVGVREMFGVNAKTGEVVLLRSPDFEKQKSYSVPVSVTDGKHFASLNLLVRIKNQNDHPPLISIRPVAQSQKKLTQPYNTGLSVPIQTGAQLPGSKSVTLFITEHDTPGRFIATVTVSDKDEADESEGVPEFSYETSQLSAHYNKDQAGQSVRCQLNHAGLALQPLFEGAMNQFKILTQVSFDREQQPEQFATLTCFDRGRPPLSSQVGLHVIVEDINDHGPVFKQSRMIAYLKENEPAGTKVYTVEAYDADLGMNAQLAFALSPESALDFQIDPVKGVVTSLRSFDREQRDSFNLTVIVRDLTDISTHSKPSNQTVTKTPHAATTVVEHSIKGDLVVYIQDVNDCPPVFANSLYQLSVPEDAKINLLVGQIIANDSDATQANNRVHYLIKQQADNQAIHEFRVSPKGYIYVARGNLDREKVSSYNFYLIAVDSGVPPLSSSAQVHIYLTDVNDNAPGWVFPAHNNQIINLTINEPVGFRMAQLKAVDPDEGENGEVTYRLVQTSIVSTKEEVERSAPINSKSTFDPNSYKFSSADNSHSPHGSSGRQTAANLFELDPSSGSIYVGRSMSLDDIGSVKLVVETSDHGQPSKVNHRVLQVNIYRYLSQSKDGAAITGEESGYADGEKGRYRMQSGSNGMQIENDLIVIVIMVAVTLVISLALIVAILFLRCGACPTRNTIHYDPSNPRGYRHDLSHAHHVEEVFRDNGALDGEGVLSPSLDPLASCAHFSESSMNSYQPNTETEPMYHSFLSSPSGDPWVVTTMNPDKFSQVSKTLNCQRGGGSMNRVPSPLCQNDAAKRASIIGPLIKSRRFDERMFTLQSASASPDGEMGQLLNKHPNQQHLASPCSTFRASCSHLTSSNPSTPCKFAGKKSAGLQKDTNNVAEREDVDSMDSGHGPSTDNGAFPSCDPPGRRSKGSQYPPGTFRCYTPTTSSSNHKTTGIKRSSEIDNADLDHVRMNALSLRKRCGTLPSPGTGEGRSLEMKTFNNRQTDQNAKERSSKGRQSVAWVDAEYQTCAHSANTRTPDSAAHRHNCQFNVPGEVAEPSEDTLVLFSPVDPLGYAQLVHPSSEHQTGTQNVYSAFPTSFV